MATVPTSHRSATGQVAPLPPVIPSVSPVLDVAPLGRRRRPSGEPPPLPRPIVASTRWYIAVAGVTLAFWFAMTTTAVAGVVTRVDLAVLRELTRMRADWLTSVMRAINEVASSWPIRTMAWATIIVLLAVRHFRHLLVYLALLVGTTVVLEAVEVSVGRMRPAGV